MSATDTGSISVRPARHTWVDDSFGILTGTLVASIGVSLLHAAGAVTGGTVGLGLLVSYATGAGFAWVYIALNLPFLALAWWKRGRSFAVRTIISVLALSALTSLNSVMFAGLSLHPLYGVLVGNVLCGVGMLMLFRHNASLGGLNTLAMLAQEYWGLRAGWVQMVLDASIVLLSLTVAPLWLVGISAVGAVLLNLVLVVNHRPGRYIGS